jgi:hypothetical protein
MILRSKSGKNEAGGEDQLSSLLCFLSPKFKSIRGKLGASKFMLIRIADKIINLMTIPISLLEI